MLCDIVEGRMLGKTTRGWKCLQMLSDITSRLRHFEERRRRQKQLAEEFVISLPHGRRPKTEIKCITNTIVQLTASSISWNLGYFCKICVIVGCCLSIHDRLPCLVFSISCSSSERFAGLGRRSRIIRTSSSSSTALVSRLYMQPWALGFAGKNLFLSSRD